MYNKLFGKILDSSIWLEDPYTRIVWITLLAAMDQDGYAHFSAIANLAIRAQVPLDKAEEAIKKLTSPDAESGDPDHEGRRIERVPGGFIILNATKYRDLATRIIQREQTRERVARHRAKKDVTKCNESVTQSYTEANTDTEVKAKRVRKDNKTPLPQDFAISDNVKEWAAKNGYSRLDEHLESFKLKCEAKDYRYVNWDSAFKNAIKGNWANINLPNDKDRSYGKGAI